MAVIAQPRLLTAKEVAATLGIQPDRVRQLVAAGHLQAVRLGGSGYYRFRVEDVEALIAGEPNP